MPVRDRITVLLGAGAMMEVTSLSSKSITEKVIAKHQTCSVDNKYEQVPFLAFVYEQLRKYYHLEPDNITFEDIFHTLEMMRSLSSTENKLTRKRFKSVFGMLCDIKEEYSGIPQALVYSGMQDLIDTVVDSIAEFENDVNKEMWFGSFFKGLQDALGIDVFTLNYDTWLEQIFEEYNDGFVPVCDTHQEFDAKILFNPANKCPTINHLHGQICFTGYSPSEPMHFLTDGWYKANDYDVIKNLKVYPKHSGYMTTTQAAEQVFEYPIITGLRKNDKIMMSPFDTYYNHFFQQLRCNKRLLIIGYGFGDLYINSLLSQFRNFHGADGKVCCIGFLDPTKWTYDMSEMPIPIPMKQTIFRMFGDVKLPYRFLNSAEDKYIESEDKTSRLYLCGLKKCATLYKEDLLRFMK